MNPNLFPVNINDEDDDDEDQESDQTTNQWKKNVFEKLLLIKIENFPSIEF